MKNFSFLFLENSLPEEFTVDYDVVIENVKELNILAGEGISKIQHTIDGARLKVRYSLNILFSAVLVSKAHFKILYICNVLRKEILTFPTGVEVPTYYFIFVFHFRCQIQYP